MNDNAMKRWSGDDAWIEQYYQNSPVEDREVFSTEELEELARAHRALAETREPNTPAVTVHNDEYSTTLLVVTDDMGYLVSSLTAEIASDFGGVYSLFHPIFIVDRDPNGKLLSARGAGRASNLASGDTATYGLPVLSAKDGKLTAHPMIESWIAIRLTRKLNDEDSERLRATALKILDDIKACETDAEAMAERVNTIAESLDALRGITLGEGEESFTAHPGGNEPSSRIEIAQDFLRWLARGNFLFMGIKERLLDGSSGYSNWQTALTRHWVSCGPPKGSTASGWKTTPSLARSGRAHSTLRRRTPAPPFRVPTTSTTLGCAASTRAGAWSANT